MSKALLCSPSLHAERCAAPTGARRVGIDEVETLPNECFLVVECHPVQIHERLGIDEHPHAVELEDAVALARMTIELDDVGETRATAPAHTQAKAAFFG